MAVVIIMLVLVAGLLSLLQEGFSMFVSLGFAAAIVGLLVLVLIMFATPRSRAMRALRQGHVHFLAKEDGYHVEGPFGSQTFRWAIYQKAYVDKRFIYLLLSDRIAQVIPLQLVTDREPLLNHLRKLGLLRPTPRTFILF